MPSCSRPGGGCSRGWSGRSLARGRLVGGPAQTHGFRSRLPATHRCGPGESVESQSHRHGRVRAADEQYGLGWRPGECASLEQDDRVAEGFGRQRVTDRRPRSFPSHRAGRTPGAEATRADPSWHRYRSRPMNRLTASPPVYRSAAHPLMIDVIRMFRVMACASHSSPANRTRPNRCKSRWPTVLERCHFRPSF